MDPIISFKLLSVEDCYQLYKWLQLSHVREFWDDGDRSLEQVYSHYLKKEAVKRYVFFIEGQAVGYCQSYLIDAKHVFNKFSLTNKITMGLDYFIGNIKFLGHGFAIPILQAFVKFYCTADCILVDPARNNLKAIYLYKKFGFVKVADYQAGNQPYCILLYCKQKITH